MAIDKKQDIRGLTPHLTRVSAIAPMNCSACWRIALVKFHPAF